MLRCLLGCSRVPISRLTRRKFQKMALKFLCATVSQSACHGADVVRISTGAIVPIEMRGPLEMRIMCATHEPAWLLLQYPPSNLPLVLIPKWHGAPAW